MLHLLYARFWHKFLFDIGVVKCPEPFQKLYHQGMEVGLRIQEKAAKVQPGQVQCKRVIAEMGGKNAIIIDDDADLDEAVVGVMLLISLMEMLPAALGTEGMSPVLGYGMPRSTSSCSVLHLPATASNSERFGVSSVAPR